MTNNQFKFPMRLLQEHFKNLKQEIDTAKIDDADRVKIETKMNMIIHALQDALED